MARAKSLTKQARSAAPRAASGLAAAESTTSAWPRTTLNVRKAYKMYIGGAFVRSESGRYTQVEETMNPRGTSAARPPGTKENIPRGSRKDAREAVLAAHGALAGWSKRVAFNRGQILYRLAEMMDARSAELTQSLVRGGLDPSLAEDEVAEAIHRVLAYAGWSDKYQSLLSSLNPVGGPHFDFTAPEPMGVVVIAAPERPCLLGLVGAIAPVIVSGNTCVVIASEKDPRTALIFGEVLATSDLPGGVVNILTGKPKEMLVPLARHMEVNALDLHSVDPALVSELGELAADTVKRLRVRTLTEKAWFDHEACTSPMWIEKFLEFKTIWHPSGG